MLIAGLGAALISLHAFAGTRAITAMDLLTLSDPSAPTLSPDGRWLAYQVTQAQLATNDYRSSWFAVSTTDPSDVRSLGSAGDISYASPGRHATGTPELREPLWTKDSTAIAYLLTVTGETQVWMSRVEDGLQRQLTHSDADVLDFRWDRDSRSLLYERGPSRDAQARYSSEARKSGYIMSESMQSYYGAALTEIDGTVERVTPLEGISYRSYDLSTGAERVATRAQWDALGSRVAGLDAGTQYHTRQPAGPMVAFTRPRADIRFPTERTPAQLASLNTSDGAVTPCEHPLCTGRMTGLSWSSDGNELYFQRLERETVDGVGFYAWSPAKRSVRRILMSDDLLVGGRAVLPTGCAMGNDLALCIHEAPTLAPEIARIDLRTGKLTRWVDLNPRLREVRFGRVTRIEFEDGNGTPAFGHFVEPPGGKASPTCPLVMTLYLSRGFLRGAVGDEYPIHLLAERGLCVLSVDRPEDRLALARLDLAEAMRSRHADARDHKSVLTAVEAAVKQLTARGWIDPKRVGISGLSDGADKATYSISHSNKIHFAAAAVSGTGMDPVIHYYGGPQYRDKDRLRIGDPFGDAQPAWREISPMLNASSIQAPLLIQASDFEYSLVVPLFLTLKEARKPVELIVYPDEKHLKVQPVHRLRVYQRNVDWFRFWLLGVEDQDPAKAEQYLRWRAFQHGGGRRSAG